MWSNWWEVSGMYTKVSAECLYVVMSSVCVSLSLFFPFFLSQTVTAIFSLLDESILRGEGPGLKFFDTCTLWKSVLSLLLVPQNKMKTWLNFVWKHFFSFRFHCTNRRMHYAGMLPDSSCRPCVMLNGSFLSLMKCCKHTVCSGHVFEIGLVVASLSVYLPRIVFGILNITDALYLCAQHAVCGWFSYLTGLVIVSIVVHYNLDGCFYFYFYFLSFLIMVSNINKYNLNG